MIDRSTGSRDLWRRLLVGVLVLVFSSATATAVAGFHEIDRVVKAFQHGHVLDLGQDLADPTTGGPQTILILGSDYRPKWSPNHEDKSRSDTMILARLDPATGTTILSLPRDLQVNIPGVGTDKLNAAYQDGGPRLALETVTQLTGLPINHVINVDFDGFQRAINALGCTYTDVDRHYFNDNSAGPSYAAIDVPEGYQRLCGGAALAFARYRHADTDIVRSARQQEILRDLKDQVSAGQLFSDRQRLIDIFGQYASSDIASREEVLALAKLAFSVAGQPVQEIHFPAHIGPSYVTASPEEIHQTIRQFLGESDSGGGASSSSHTHRGSTTHAARSEPARSVPIEASPEAQGAAVAAQQAGVSIPVYYPQLKSPGATLVGTPRVYSIMSPDGQEFSSYRMVFKTAVSDTGDVGQYYGVQGTAWKDPPILDRPSDVRHHDGRTFEVYTDAGRVRLVAWRTGDGVYWISNTLLQTLSEDQMLAIAESTRPL